MFHEIYMKPTTMSIHIMSFMHYDIFLAIISKKPI